MRTAAIFDVDGTLLPWPSTELRFAGHLLRRRVLRPRDLMALPWRWGGLAARSRSLAKASRAYLAGRAVGHVQRCVEGFFQQSIAGSLSPLALARVRAHESEGHLIILLSGTLDFLLIPLQMLLRAHVGIGTRLEEKAGAFTGRVAGRNVSGKEKARWLIDLEQAYDLDLRRSYAYGNHYLDRYFLQMVGYPVAVNPDRRLRAQGLTRRWAIEVWNS